MTDQISKEFSLQGSEYIELDKVLKLLRIASSGGGAHLMISSGEIIVNNAIETRKRKKLFPGDIVKFREQQIKIIL